MPTGRKPPKRRPTEKQVAMLRRIAAGKLVVTMVDGEPTYTYEDGVRADYSAARTLINNGWVKPESPPLFGELAQSYVAAKP